MPNSDTLLSFIAQRHTFGLEDVATDALSFILSRSAPARKALSEFLGLPIAKAQTWLADEHGATPDLALLDKDGNTVALIESKFWATLTHHQPVTYWRQLPSDKCAVLLFLAPGERLDYLWCELEAKLRDKGHELGPAVKDGELITAPSKDGRRRLMATSWQLLLGKMAQKAKECGDTQASFEIAELQGLAASAIKGDRPTRDENLKQLIAEAVKRVEQSGWANANELGVSSGIYFYHSRRIHYYGRYLRLAGAFAWLGIDYGAKKRMPDKPLWLSFLRDNGVDITVKLEEVRSKLKGLVETGLDWRSKEVYLPIVLPAGADLDKTLDCIVAQLESIAKRIDPKGPTYQ